MASDVNDSLGEPTVALLEDPTLVSGDLRSQILAALTSPDSATGLSQRLGVSRQKLNYHLRALESAGLVELESTRQRRGLEERIMRRSADVVLVDPMIFSALELGSRDVVGITATITTAADLIRQSAVLARQATERGERVATATLDTEISVKSPKAMRQMLDELARVLARHDTNGEGMGMRVVVNLLPAARVSP